MQYRGMPFLVLLVILLSAVAVNGNVNAMRYQNLFDGERAWRMGAEKALKDATMVNDALRKDRASLRQQLENIQSIVNQGDSKASGLEKQLQQIQQENMDLKQKVQNLQNQTQQPPAPAADAGQ